MTDRIVLHDMVFMGRHGVLEHEQREAQPFHVDVELVLDLQPAGIDDDLTRSVDYGTSSRPAGDRRVDELPADRGACRGDRPRAPGGLPDRGGTVRVRKPNAPIDGTLDYAGVEVQRSRPRR